MRIQLYLKTEHEDHMHINMKRYFVDFPVMPEEGQLIDVGSMVHGIELDEETIDSLASMLFRIQSVMWIKDEAGVFAQLECTGE
jgi:hypothetical protein